MVHPPQRRTSADREAIIRNAAAAGLRVEIEEEPPVLIDVWPDHWELIAVARRMQTQLNVTMGGVLGWRHEALPHAFRMLGVPLARQREIADDLLTLELGIVAELNKAAKS